MGNKCASRKGTPVVRDEQETERIPLSAQTDDEADDLAVDHLVVISPPSSIRYVRSFDSKSFTTPPRVKSIRKRPVHPNLPPIHEERDGVTNNGDTAPSKKAKIPHNDSPWSRQLRTIKLIGLLDDDDFELEEGMILLGFLIPYLDYEKYFLFFLDFLVEDTKEIKDIVTKAFKYSDFDDVNEFMITEFPTILETLFFDEEALESKKPMLELVPNLLKGND